MDSHGKARLQAECGADRNSFLLSCSASLCAFHTTINTHLYRLRPLCGGPVRLIKRLGAWDASAECSAGEFAN